MLPNVLARSYNDYKEHATVFTIWLTKVEFACGYQDRKDIHQGETRPKEQGIQGPTSGLICKARREAKAGVDASEVSPIDVPPTPSVTKWKSLSGCFSSKPMLLQQ